MPERTVMYLRVSTDSQTVENQRLDLQKLAELRKWTVSEVYQDEGISGSTGREKRPALDRLLKDAARGRFERVIVWAVDRLGRSTAATCTAMAELEACGVKQTYFKEGIDTGSPHGRAMIQMAAVFAELEKAMIVERVRSGIARARAQGKTLGRPKVDRNIEVKIRAGLAKRVGILKLAKLHGVGTSVVQRVKKEAA